MDYRHRLSVDWVVHAIMDVTNFAVQAVGRSLRVFFDVITSIVSFLWEYTTAARDVTF